MDDVESWVEPFFNAYRSEILHRNVLEGSIAEAEREADREVPAFALPAVKFGPESVKAAHCFRNSCN